MARRRYDKTRADRFLENLRKGAPLTLAAQAAGLDLADVREWASRRREFAEQMRDARSHQALATALTIQKAAYADPQVAEKVSARLLQESELERLRLLTADAA